MSSCHFGNNKSNMSSEAMGALTPLGKDPRIEVQSTGTEKIAGKGGGGRRRGLWSDPLA